MLSLREENEEVEEKEYEVEEDQFTYDRPELHNKVTLRRSTTGLWQVCSSVCKDDSAKDTKSHRARRKRHALADSADKQCMQPGVVLQNNHLDSGLGERPYIEEKQNLDVTFNKQKHSRRVLTSVSIPIAPDVLSAIRAKQKNSFDGNGCIGSRTRRRTTESTAVLNSNGSSSLKISPAQTKPNNSVSLSNSKYQTRQKYLNDS